MNGFTDQQLAQLRAPLDRSLLPPPRPGNNGMKIYYMDHWLIEEMANLIFGFDGWDSETVHLEQIHEPQLLVTEQQAENFRACGVPLQIVATPGQGQTPHKPQVVASWRASVKLTVRAGDRRIVRTRNGASRNFAATLGEAVEMALKSAETDAMKRAFSSFGGQFGLSLYDKHDRNVVALRQHEQPAIDVGFGDRDRRPAINPPDQPSISQRARAAPRELSPAEREQHHQRGMPV